MATFFVESGGVKLAVNERGVRDAPTVLFVHGYPDTSATWNAVADELSSRFHVVAYDVRGSGDSDRPHRRAAYRLEVLAADIRAVADAVSPHAAVHLVGHDWGSVQCWEAVTDPETQSRFASFTSISGPSLDHGGFWTRDRLASRRPSGVFAVLGQARRSWYIAVMHVPGLVPLMWRAFLGRAFAPSIRKMEGIPQRADWPAPTLVKDGARGVQIYRANVLSRMGKPRERYTNVPIQVIVPTGDRYLSPSMVSDDVARWCDTVWVRRVRSGHWLQQKSPEALAHAVTEVVSHVEGQPESRALRRLRVTADEPATRKGRKAKKDFTDRLVVVTGAGSGIGRETAMAFSRLGAEVVIAELQEASGERTAAELRATGATAHAYAVDVSDVASMEDFAKRVIADHGVPDVVVNNAGIGIAGSFLDTSAEDWQRIVDVNLLGVVHGCRLFGAAMAERLEGGYIVNVASAAAFTPSRMLGAYSTTKAAVLMLSECLGAELRDSGIGVSAICPGIVNTPITTATRYVGLSEDEQREKASSISKQYARRNYPPSKVAEAIVKAVQRRTPVVPVTPEAAGARLLSRVSPAAMRRLARVEVK
ncbi:MAG TPA: SDR family oxidoreductase [Mycobacteriales bacterium]|nr:SDR family oxidoreductase [Mycobacteriales bacterium]